MKLLLVSIACPPKKDPECLQVAKILKYLLKDNDLNIDILTSSIPTLFMPYDASLEKYLMGINKIDYLKVWENKYSNFVLRKGFSGFHFPDSKFLFHFQSKKALNLIDHNIDLIYSRSYPLSSAILAKKIKESLKKPWVMHLSDPWSFSPLHNYKGKTAQLHADTERECIANSDAVTFTSEKTLDLYKRHYPQYRDKFYFFPNVYDPEDEEGLAIQFEGKLRIVHTGGLIESRNPRSFLEVLTKIYVEVPSLANNLEVIFAGEADRRTRKIFNSCSLPFVKYIGPVAYFEAIKLQKSAHMLLLIDNDFDEEGMGVFFPSKLLDYFLTKRRVFAITSGKSETTNVLKNYLSSSCFRHHETDRMAVEILCALDHFKEHNSAYFVSDSIPELYNAKKQSQKLKELFMEICQK